MLLAAVVLFVIAIGLLIFQVATAAASTLLWIAAILAIIAVVLLVVPRISSRR